ncbi:MAG: hypothetical protein LBS07_06525, partial [Prevotellaceae bacterium]|nr:hypothetical protein [Prevotellaceae bacterium]
MKIKITCLMLVLASVLSVKVFAGWGFWGDDRSYIVIGGTTHVVYYSGDQFSVKNLGTDVTGALTLSAYDAKTWKNGNGDVTGITFYYCVYTTPPPAFTSITGGFMEDWGNGNQKWGFSGKSINLNPGIPGNYTFEFYAELRGKEGSTGGSNYDNGNGTNYKGTFTVRPNAPSNIRLTYISSTKAVVAWDAVSGADEYRVRSEER